MPSQAVSIVNRCEYMDAADIQCVNQKAIASSNSLRWWLFGLEELMKSPNQPNLFFLLLLLLLLHRCTAAVGVGVTVACLLATMIPLLLISRSFPNNNQVYEARKIGSCTRTMTHCPRNKNDKRNTKYTLSTWKSKQCEQKRSENRDENYW